MNPFANYYLNRRALIARLTRNDSQPEGFKLKWTTTLVLALAVGAPITAPAALITQTLGFDTSTPVINTTGANADALVFNTFDSNTGTLDTVEIRITGNLLVNVTSPPSPQGSPPAPYVFGFNSELEFGGFGFLINPTIIANGSNGGSVTPHTFNFAYTYTATLDASSDLLGFAAIGTSSLLTNAGLAVNELSPPFMSLSRAALSANVPGLPFVVLPQLTVSGFSSAAVAPSGTATSNGDIAITYNYTPVAAAMPEPGSMALLALGLVLGMRSWNGAGKRAC